MECVSVILCETIVCLLPDEKEEKAYGTQKAGERGCFQDD